MTKIKEKTRDKVSFVGKTIHLGVQSASSFSSILPQKNSSINIAMQHFFIIF